MGVIRLGGRTAINTDPNGHPEHPDYKSDRLLHILNIDRQLF